MAKQPSPTFEQPGLTPAPTTLRVAEFVRLELLRLVWRPDRDAATAIMAAKELEKYVSGTAPD